MLLADGCRCAAGADAVLLCSEPLPVMQASHQELGAKEQWKIWQFIDCFHHRVVICERTSCQASIMAVTLTGSFVIGDAHRRQKALNPIAIVCHSLKRNLAMIVKNTL
jgi:hypothetical protein